MNLSMLLAVSLALPQAEFAKYYETITGRAPEEGALRLAIDPSVSKTGKDAYTIVSEGRGARISGSNLRSVFYGVYDLLERRGGCHWFWDGDVVPKRESIDLSGLDVREEAQFEWRGIRYFAHRGLTRFQAEHWGLDDWKKEIDWCLKRRLNVFMLRIGQDDLFQRTFPDVVGYPDASRDLPGHGAGYDNRTLFWSLQYRGRLRQDLQRYAFDRGLEIPEDFGTMTHWYSRTPEDFLDKVNPPFLPQATSGYKERNGLVWDIRDDKWVDMYWKLTQTAVEAYGKPGPGLLHTIGLGERLCYTNRADNLKLKMLALDKFLKRAHRDYPDRKVLLAGWDFFFTWSPEEVRELVKTLDPKRDIIWDYEGDATCDYRLEMQGKQNNFTKWGVVGKFPYTYSIFLAFEDALDIRANYPLIEERQKIVQNDPFCAGYILWPESSHTDTLCLRYFTANAWKKGGVSSSDVLDEFCASRYGEDAEAWKALWRGVLPMSQLEDWGGNYGRAAAFHDSMQDPERGRDLYNDASHWERRSVPAQLGAVPGVMRSLAALDWRKTSFTERDAIDLARTAGDRMVSAARDDLMRAYHAWRNGSVPAPEVLRKSRAYAAMGALMADLLALHTDYSLAESFDRLNAVEPVRNPNFPKVLVENATCNYCASHQYEAAEYWYKPAMRAFADMIAGKVSGGDRTPIPLQPRLAAYRAAHMNARPLSEMRPTLPRTQESFSRVLMAFAAAAEEFMR
ncbi:MAG: hypothetical protein IJG84_02735 [Kiritimatiellae bacterium]|nr:hypothetical protein [Kiritimatiellia bacterium]